MDHTYIQGRRLLNWGRYGLLVGMVEMRTCKKNSVHQSDCAHQTTYMGDRRSIIEPSRTKTNLMKRNHGEHRELIQNSFMNFLEIILSPENCNKNTTDTFSDVLSKLIFPTSRQTFMIYYCYLTLGNLPFSLKSNRFIRQSLTTPTKSINFIGREVSIMLQKSAENI